MSFATGPQWGPLGGSRGAPGRAPENIHDTGIAYFHTDRPEGNEGRERYAEIDGNDLKHEFSPDSFVSLKHSMLPESYLDPK